MAQDTEIPHEYITNLPKSQCVIQLLDIAQKEVGSRPIRFCDLSKYPEQSKAKGYGRYESDKQIIWIRLGLPSYVTEFVVGHELGHSLQWARGYPRVSIRDMLRDFRVSNEQKQSHPDIIVRIHWLTDGISNLLQDPGADEIARTYGLLTKEALEYLRSEDQTGIKSIVLPDFDCVKFRSNVESVLEKIWLGQNPTSHYDFVSSLETARLATVYVTQKLRYEPFGLFKLNDNAYEENRPTVRKLGRKLAAIVESHKLQTPKGCKEIAEKLIEYLQIPQDAVGIRVADSWIT